VPVVDSSFYSEQSVRKTRIISLSDVSGRAHSFLVASEIRGLRVQVKVWKRLEGRLIAVDVRCAPQSGCRRLWQRFVAMGVDDTKM
jgi:hypothetical protein